MKFLLSLAAMAVVSASVIEANAATCAQRANQCIKNGGTRGVCFAKQTMDNCKRTGTYVGPYSGKSFEASGR